MFDIGVDRWGRPSFQVRVDSGAGRPYWFWLTWANTFETPWAAIHVGQPVVLTRRLDGPDGDPYFRVQVQE